MGGLPGLPFDHSVAGVRGAAAGVAIPVAGINAGDSLLCVVQHNAATPTLAGLDPAAFTVAAGEIESASLDTSGDFLLVVYSDQG